MYSHQPEPLTQPSAKSIAREWINNRIAKLTKAHAWSQMRWLMEQLAEQCIAESLRLGEDEDGLCERLVKANEIIYCAWYSTAPEYATRWQLDKKDEVSPQEQEEIDRTQHILWKRHDPKRSFSEGTRSEHYTNFDKDSLHSTIADYLSRPYLRHPVLDWIFMDMTISREISEFGEALKQSWLPGKRDPLLGVHSRYNKTQGNLAEMTKVDWNDVFGRWNTLFWWTLGFLACTRFRRHQVRCFYGTGGE